MRSAVLDGAVIRCVFAERIMNPVLLVIGNVFSEQPAKMAFIQCDDMVEGGLATATNQIIHLLS
jgi:hypothetical protein